MACVVYLFEWILTILWRFCHFLKNVKTMFSCYERFFSIVVNLNRSIFIRKFEFDYRHARHSKIKFLPSYPTNDPSRPNGTKEILCPSCRRLTRQRKERKGERERDNAGDIKTRGIKVKRPRGYGSRAEGKNSRLWNAVNFLKVFICFRNERAEAVIKRRGIICFSRFV